MSARKPSDASLQLGAVMPVIQKSVFPRLCRTRATIGTMDNATTDAEKRSLVPGSVRLCSAFCRRFTAVASKGGLGNMVLQFSGQFFQLPKTWLSPRSKASTRLYHTNPQATPQCYHCYFLYNSYYYHYSYSY